MDTRRYRLPATIALLLGFSVLYFIILLTAVNAVGTDSDLYYSEQMKAGILPGAGISEVDLHALDATLSTYLSGWNPRIDRIDDPQAWLPEAQRNAFNERELTHLRDCLGLFDLLRKVRGRLIPWAILLIVGGVYILRDRKRIRLCAWLSPLILVLPLGAFAIYAISDFDRAFTLFHSLLFTNDLWLLDPATDLLIRICPESMFMNMGVRIGVYSLAGMLAVSAIATLLTFIWPKGKEDDTWNNRAMRRGSAQKQITFGRTGMR